MRSPLSRLALLLSALLVSVCAEVESARSEVFVLKNGGRVTGEWLNRQATRRTTYVVRTSQGAEVALPKDRIARILTPSASEEEYEKVRPTFADTVEGHERLAAWCLEKHLGPQRKEHLRRIVELDPEHEKARTALGYRRVGDKWLSRDEEMAARGFHRHQGQYRTKQDIALREQEGKEKLAEKEWFRRLKMWRAWLNKEEKSQLAKKNILAIQDPFATKALAHYLEREPIREAKELYMEALARLATPLAVQTLADASLEDPDEEVRLTAIDHLVRGRHNNVLAQYIQALGHKDNRRVNRAAIALGELNNPAAIVPLIDALITVHKERIRANQNQQNASFPTGGGGGGGMTWGKKPDVIIKNHVRNHDVRAALIKLTGKDFGFQIDTWKRWYASREQPPAASTRRD